MVGPALVFRELFSSSCISEILGSSVLAGTSGSAWLSRYCHDLDLWGFLFTNLLGELLLCLGLAVRQAIFDLSTTQIKLGRCITSRRVRAARVDLVTAPTALENVLVYVQTW